MTQPRFRVPGATVHITRTVSERRFLLMPLGPVSSAVLYCFYLAAKTRGIKVHCLFVHKNHYHAVITDPNGELSDYTHDVLMTVGRSLLPHYREMKGGQNLGVLWDPAEKTNEVILPTQNAVLDKIVYDITNPVRDGMLYSHRDWPGILLGPRDWTRPAFEVPRPEHFFIEGGVTPATVQCKLEPPPHFEDRTVEKLIADIGQLVDDKERAIRATMRAQGRSFIGLKKLLCDSPFASPPTPRPKGKIKPSVAGGGDPSLYKTAVTHIRHFRMRYRECLAEVARLLVEGLDPYGVTFPFGTLLMTKRHGFACDDEQLDWCLLAHAPP
jgi:hypothetical protein